MSMPDATAPKGQTMSREGFGVPATMSAVLLTGHGGSEKLEFRTDVATPSPRAGEVLIRVRAAGVNNTDINTRTGWYAKSVTGASGEAGVAATGENGGWTGALKFPRIQGADCFGDIVAVGPGVDTARIGQPVLVATMQNGLGNGEPYSFGTLGSECDGAFAQYCMALSAEAHRVDSTLSDAELGAIPCAWSTAEGMLQRIGLGAGERVLVTGASGGVGLAAVQLAKLRGAAVAAQSAPDKAQAVRDCGADEIVGREAIGADALAENGFDAIVDVVGGPQFAHMPRLLRPGGRYVACGAIAGPMVGFDLRDLYLKDLSLHGATWQPPGVFEALVGHVNNGRLKPLVSKIFPLRDIAAAQEAFLSKQYPGKIVLIP